MPKEEKGKKKGKEKKEKERKGQLRCLKYCEECQLPVGVSTYKCPVCKCTTFILPTKRDKESWFS